MIFNCSLFQTFHRFGQKPRSHQSESSFWKGRWRQRWKVWRMALWQKTHYGTHLFLGKFSWCALRVSKQMWGR